MVWSKINANSRGARGQAFIVKVNERKELFVNFPRGCEISYKFDDESLGNVANYDHKNGRILTDRGGSHDPTELKVIKLPEKEK